MLKLQSRAVFSIRYIDGDIYWLERLMTRPDDFINGVMILCWIISKIGWLYGVMQDVRTTIAEIDQESFRIEPYSRAKFVLMVFTIKYLISLRWGVLGI